MTIQKAKKIPVEIEYIQYSGENKEEICNWSNGKVHQAYDDNFHTIFGVDTLNGFLHVNINDYIIKDVENEFYPIKPNIFNKTFRM